MAGSSTAAPEGFWMKKRMVGQMLIGTGLLFVVVGLVLFKMGQPMLLCAA